MKIMLVIPKMTSGGAERVAANLCNYWCKDNEVRIVAIASKDSFYKLDKRVELRGQNLNINRKNMFTTIGCLAKYYPKTVKFVKKNIKEFNPDCVISLLVEADFVTYLATKNNNKIVKVFSERADPTRRNKIRQMMAKKAYSICDLFVCQSKKMKEYYDFLTNAKKLVIPNPLDISVLSNPLLDEKNHNIVSVGRLSEQKNYELLINSFVASVDRIPNDCNLMIYGDGPMKANLQSLIKSLDMSDRIKLVGVSKNVLEEIAGCALFVLPSNYEGFPNVLLEAMATGLPVISTDFYTGVAKELIKKENGLVVPTGDTEKMTKAIVDLMNDKKKRTQMRKNNILVRDKFDVKIIGEIWIMNIKQLIGSSDE